MTICIFEFITSITNESDHLSHFCDTDSVYKVRRSQSFLIIYAPWAVSFHFVARSVLAKLCQLYWSFLITCLSWFLNIWKESHLLHLNVNAPHNLSGKWVAQHHLDQDMLMTSHIQEIATLIQGRFKNVEGPTDFMLRWHWPDRQGHCPGF